MRLAGLTLVFLGVAVIAAAFLAGCAHDPRASDCKGCVTYPLGGPSPVMAF